MHGRRSRELGRVPRCTTCQHSIPVDLPRCDRCGTWFLQVELYDPRSFTWLAALFTAAVPLYLAATNLGLMGRQSEKRTLLGIGSAIFVTALVLFSILPPFSGNMWVFVVVNALVGWRIASRQRELFEQAQQLGAVRAFTLPGAVLGGVLASGLFVVAATPVVTVHVVQFNRAVELMDKRDYRQAARIFELYSSRDPGDEQSAFNLEICRGRLAERRGDLPAAIEHYRAAAEIYPDEIWVHQQIEWCRLRLGDVATRSGAGEPV